MRMGLRMTYQTRKAINIQILFQSIIYQLKNLTFM